MNNQICPLCEGKAIEFFIKKNTTYFSCNKCAGIFIDKNLLPSQESEKSRYLEHNNDINNIHYQNFVKPIVNNILKDFNNLHIGLDFGAGTGPVISKLLNDQKYITKLYDPYFYNYPKLLDKKYNYIICCEVIEHFYNPRKEFLLLKTLLKEKGKLYCMTSIYKDSIDFKTWYYKDDKTHVFIYRKETLEYIFNEFGFSDLKIKDNLIVFSDFNYIA